MKLIILLILSGFVWSDKPFNSLEADVNCQYFAQSQRPKDYPPKAPLYVGWYTCKEASLKSFYIFPLNEKVKLKDWAGAMMKLSLSSQEDEKVTHMTPVSFMQGTQFIHGATYSKSSKVKYHYGFYHFRRGKKRYVLYYTDDLLIFNRNKKQVFSKLKKIISQSM